MQPIDATCMKQDCTGGRTCPMYSCIRHVVQVVKNIGDCYSSLRCIYCAARLTVMLPKHIPESQRNMYLEGVADKINKGEIELINEK